MPTLRNHTHCQPAQSNHTSQNLQKSIFVLTHGRQQIEQESTLIKPLGMQTVKDLEIPHHV